MAKYVQHVSGQGEKWEVSYEDHLIYHSCDRHIPLSLPKSEYREVPGPEEYEDVTGECALLDDGRVLNLSPGRAMAGQYIPIVDGYRWREVQVNFPAEGHAPTGSPARCGWAFLVERKKG